MSKEKELKFTYMDHIRVDITLKRKRTVLNGDSVTEKTYIYKVIQQYKEENDVQDILCLNTDNVDEHYIHHTIEKMRNIQDGLIVIDQADDVLENKALRDYVFGDKNNFYILMGNNEVRLSRSFSELAWPVISKDRISIMYRLNSI